jgi:hypothetical protein
LGTGTDPRTLLARPFKAALIESGHIMKGDAIMAADVYERVMDLARRRGFVWPTSECYGAVAGFIDYGPLGAMMKGRIEETWRSFYVVREGFY